MIKRKWPEHLKAARAGKLMMWGVGWTRRRPDGQGVPGARLRAATRASRTMARFDLPAFNAALRAQRVLPDGPERAALLDEAKRLMVAYMPYKVHVHRICTDLSQPWVTGYRRHCSCASAGSTSTSTWTSCARRGKP